MARMHSRQKGKSGSSRPVEKTVPTWVTYKAKEVEALVTKLAKQGMSAARIGLTLRDSYGVPSVKIITGKSIVKILEEHKVAKQLPEDLLMLIRRNIAIRKHIEANPSDMTAKRGLSLTSAKIYRLIKYYKKTERLASDWKFDAEKAQLYLE